METTDQGVRAFDGSFIYFIRGGTLGPDHQGYDNADVVMGIPAGLGFFDYSTV